MPPKDYYLSEDENRRIFEEQIRPADFKHLEQYGHGDGTQPVCVLVAGQTGAGKTRTAPQVISTLTNMGRHFVHLIADTYKTYHPQYSQLLVDKPALASPATGYDARKWLALSCDHAIHLRLDSLVESACRNPEDFTSLADAFHRAGFRVLVIVLAVHEAQSRLGVLVRYFNDLPEARSRNLPLRLTPRNVHDESYHGLVKVAEFIDSSDAVDKVVIVRRGNFVGYTNSRDGEGKWQHASKATKALALERGRPNVAPEVEAFNSDLRKLRDEHPEKESELGEIEALFSDFQSKEFPTGTFWPLQELDCPAFIGAEEPQHKS